MTKYIFICAAGHSGSTLLDRILGSHSEIESLGEISHLPKNIKLNTQCSCGQPVRSCAVWKGIISQMSLRIGVDIINTPYALNLGYLDPVVNGDKDYHGLVNRFRKNFYHGLWFANLRYNMDWLNVFLGPVYRGIDNNFLLYDSVRTVREVKMIVDSSKHYLKATELYRKRPNDVRIIHLTRDGRGVFYSALKRNFQAKKFVKGWVRHYKRSIPLLNTYVNQKHILRIKYEDIARDPRNEIKKICNFVGVTYEEKMLNFADSTQHLTDGNNMRFSKSSKIILDNAWLDKLSASDKRWFDSVAGKLNNELGYC